MSGRAGFLAALYQGVSPNANDIQLKTETLNTIVGPRFDGGFKASVKNPAPPGKYCSGAVEYLTVDSGACDSAAHPASFPHAKDIRSQEYGKLYGACGGEAVQNIGTNP